MAEGQYKVYAAFCRMMLKKAQRDLSNSTDSAEQAVLGRMIHNLRDTLSALKIVEPVSESLSRGTD